MGVGGTDDESEMAGPESKMGGGPGPWMMVCWRQQGS